MGYLLIKMMKTLRTFQRERVMETNEKGLTLIELMISFVVLSIVLIGAFQVLTAAHQMSMESRSRLLALNAGRTVLEEIKNTGLTNVTGINTAQYVPAELSNGAIAITTNPANLSGAAVATVTVTVSWRGPRNRLLSLQLSTMRSAYS